MSIVNEVELDLERHFEDPSVIDTRCPCEGCDGTGGVEWDDHIVGPCPACQGNPVE